MHFSKAFHGITQDSFAVKLKANGVSVEIQSHLKLIIKTGGKYLQF